MDMHIRNIASLTSAETSTLFYLCHSYSCSQVFSLWLTFFVTSITFIQGVQLLSAFLEFWYHSRVTRQLKVDDLNGIMSLTASHLQHFGKYSPSSRLIRFCSRSTNLRKLGN